MARDGVDTAPSLQPRRYAYRDGRYKRPQCTWAKKRNWPIRAGLYRRADFTCQECGYRPPAADIPADYDGSRTVGDLVIDHVVPLWNDGDRAGDNLQVLCKRCNGRKN